MISPQEFVTKWGEQRLGRVSAEALKAINVPQSSKDFLTEAGLPLYVNFGFHFDVPSDKLPRLPEVPNRYNRTSLPAEYDCYWKIGSDGGGEAVCIEEGSGHIVAVDIYNGEKTLISSSVPQLAEILLVLEEYVAEYEDVLTSLDGLPQEELDAVADILEARIKAVDEQAMSPGSYWDNYTDGIRYFS